MLIELLLGLQKLILIEHIRHQKRQAILLLLQTFELFTRRYIPGALVRLYMQIIVSPA